MIQQDFATHAVEIVKKIPNVLGLAAGGSYISGELDEYSDLDLVLVTAEKISDSKEEMTAFAKKLGDFISGFTGDHVGEKRLLICLYDNPLLHVDIKFLTLPELHDRVEDPIILFERDEALTQVIRSTPAKWPQPSFQWIEDRFWTWVHYLATKAARGEYFECLDGLGMIRSAVLAPLLQVKSKTTVRGVRKVENKLKLPDLEDLKITVAHYSRSSVLKALDNSVSVYRMLRRKLFDEHIQLQTRAEKKAMEFLKQVKNT